MDQLRKAWQTFTDILSWATDRMSVTQDPSLTVLASVAVLAAILCTVPNTWHTLRYLVTIVHEMGHATIAWLVGRRLAGISVHTDTSGVTLSAGKPHGLGMLATLLAGYSAPPLVGLGLTWAAVSGWSGAGLTLVVVMLAAAFLLSRNLVGLVAVAASLSLIGYVWWINDPTMVATVTCGLGVFLLIAGFRGGYDLWVVHHRGEGESSDASQIGRLTHTPALLWVFVFAAVGIGSVIRAATIIAPII